MGNNIRQPLIGVKLETLQPFTNDSVSGEITDGNGDIPPQFLVYQKVLGTEANQLFGNALTMTDDGSIIATGTQEKDGVGDIEGSVFIIEKIAGTWTRGQKLTCPPGEVASNLAPRFRLPKITADGLYLFVGSERARDNGSFTVAGLVFCYKNVGGTYTLVDTLDAIDLVSGDTFNFGSTLSVTSDGQTVFAGAVSSNSNGSNSGGMYIFERSGDSWLDTKVMYGSDWTGGSNGGQQCVISDNGIAVASAGLNHQAIYVWVRSGGVWSTTQQQKITEASVTIRFGNTLGITKDGLFMFANDREFIVDSLSNAGKIFLYKFNGSTYDLHQEIVSNTPLVNGRFGSLSMFAPDGQRIYIWEQVAPSRWIAQVYKYNSLTDLFEYEQDVDAQPEDIANGGPAFPTTNLENTILAYGGPFDDEATSDAGCVYVLEAL